MNARLLILPATILLLASCNGPESGKSRGPIRLGDSSAIVTETNAALLQDEVADLQPVENTEGVSKATSAIAGHDTTTATALPGSRPQAPIGNGLTVAFKEVTLGIPGITTRMFGKPDLQKARGASYELTGGKLAGAQLQVSGSPVTRVSQRTQTMLKLKDGADELVLESLPGYTSSWQTLMSAGGAYSIAGLEPDKLEYKLPSPSALKNAVQTAARKAKLDRKDTQAWLKAAQGLRSASVAPAVVVLRSAMWRVEGKGFSKELRVDVPVQK